MSEAGQHRLAALLSADVVGYSRLMADDEAATVATLSDYREHISGSIARRGGRLVDFTGDNFLAEFPSAVDALLCAVAIQEELATRNAELVPSRRMLFRMGAHLGEVRVEGERIFGEGVNLASRLEGLAEPGGISVSAAIRDQVRGKLDLEMRDRGEHQVKNVVAPLRVYAVSMGAPQAEPAAEGRRHAPWAVLLGLGIALIGLVAWAFWERVGPELGGVWSGPKEPLIAVLPFANSGADPEQEYFADGITDDLITDLSKVSGLMVISSRSAFAYKGRPPDEVREALGASHVLEGTVRRDGDDVRVSAELVDTGSGTVVWSERYTPTLSEIFAVQDEVSRQIVAALELRLTDAVRERMESVPTHNMEAYDQFLRGNARIRRLNREDNLEARRHALRAIELDPQLASGYGLLAGTYFFEWLFQWGDDREGALQAARDYTRRAAELGADGPQLQYNLFALLRIDGRHDEAFETARRAARDYPGHAISQLALGQALLQRGETEEALEVLKHAVMMDPAFAVPEMFEGYAYEALGRYPEAIAAWERVLEREPDYLPAHLGLAALHSEMGDLGAARRAAQEVRRISPDYSLEAVDSHDATIGSFLDRYRTALERAGLEG